MTTYDEYAAEVDRIRFDERNAQYTAREATKALFRRVVSRVRELRHELRLTASETAGRLHCTVESYMDTEDGASENLEFAMRALKLLDAEARRRAKEKEGAS